MKSDQELAIRALKEAVMGFGPIEIFPEESPTYEHQANGAVENANKRIAEQVRTMKIALENRYGVKIGSNHPILPWLVRYAANILSWYKIGQDGKTCYEKLKGRKYNRGVAESGECVLYLRAVSAG